MVKTEVGGALEEGVGPCQMGGHSVGGGHLVGMVSRGQPSCGRGLFVGSAILWAWPFTWGCHLVGMTIMWAAILWAWSFTWGGHLVGVAISFG